jgi:hypothetical protein
VALDVSGAPSFLEKRFFPLYLGIKRSQHWRIGAPATVNGSQVHTKFIEAAL